MFRPSPVSPRLRRDRLFYGIAAPKHTPPEIIDNVNGEGNASLTMVRSKRAPQVRLHLVTSSPADFEKFIAAEIDKWGKVIRTANIDPRQ